jgi:hypothetical protein
LVAASFYVEAGGMRAWLRRGVDLAALAQPDGDPDRLLASAGCRLVKDQRKVTVGEVAASGDARLGETAATSIYVKRYNVFSWRVRLTSLVQHSPAFRAWEATMVLSAAGFRAPPPLAAVEYRRWWGSLEKSFFLTARVDGAVPADQYWWRLRRAPQGARREFIAGLARLFACLHAAGVYHNDLKDANVLVRATSGGLAYYLLDLERVRRCAVVSMRRRVKNIVQLHRTLGRLATVRENLYFLHVYLGDGQAARGVRRRWRRRVCAAARRKDLYHVLRGVS